MREGNRIMDAGQLLDRLRLTGAVRFTARAEGPVGWERRGVGSVVVEPDDAGVVIFRESGTWRPAGGDDLRFRNAYRWAATGERAVSLEHLRLGDERPVFLFELAPETTSSWASVAPHPCGEDRYSARLLVEDEHITLRWTVIGPRKVEAIEATYY